MTPEMRKETVLQHEGQVLAMAMSGTEHACDIARCLIDGAMNALIRMEGREEAAKFAFKVSDRVAGGLRTPTEWHAAVALPAPASSPTAPPVPKKKSRFGYLAQPLLCWAAGFFAGFTVGHR